MNQNIICILINKSRRKQHRIYYSTYVRPYQHLSYALYNPIKIYIYISYSELKKQQHAIRHYIDVLLNFDLYIYIIKTI